MADCLPQITQIFQEANPEWTITHHFAGSHSLIRQIEEGIKADLLLCAHPDLSEGLHAKGLAAPPMVLFTNPLVGVVPKDNPAGIRTLEDLAQPGIKVVLAQKEVPVGRYAREILGGLGVKEKVLANLVSQEESVQGVLGKILMGEADAGIVYYTDLQGAGDQVRPILIPPKDNALGTYTLSVIGKEENLPAESLGRYLLSNKAMTRWRRCGFQK